ncbi:MAG: hypothetical protein ACEPOV_04045 [Hyphomicrobiales bacterium]
MPRSDRKGSQNRGRGMGQGLCRCKSSRRFSEGFLEEAPTKDRRGLGKGCKQGKMRGMR